MSITTFEYAPKNIHRLLCVNYAPRGVCGVCVCVGWGKGGVGWRGGGIITSYSCVSLGGGENARFHFADERGIHIGFVSGRIFTLVI